MFYRYNKKELFFKKDLTLMPIIVAALVLSSAGWYIAGLNKSFDSLSEYEKNVILIHMDRKPFEEQQLIDLMKELNMKFPHIVLAQAKVESGYFKSRIFKENHNLFGMKQAQQRINTAKGTQHSHAFYDSWESSVYDYAFYQCRYLSSIRTEDEYYRYLAGSYAEDPHYISKLKEIVKREKLVEKFK